MAARRTDAATRARREASAAIERRLLAAADVFIARDLDPPTLRLVAEAKVSKTFWYDHPELRDKVEERFADAREHRVEDAAHGAVVTVASLKSENDTLQAIITRKDQVIAKLERRVGELMGDQKRPALPEEREVHAHVDELSASSPRSSTTTRGCASRTSSSRPVWMPPASSTAVTSTSCKVAAMVPDQLSSQWPKLLWRFVCQVRCTGCPRPGRASGSAEGAAGLTGLRDARSDSYARVGCRRTGFRRESPLSKDRAWPGRVAHS